MPYVDKYREYLDLLTEKTLSCVDNSKHLVFGYTSNLDVIVKWDINKFNSILDKYLKQTPWNYERQTLSSAESFASAVSYYAMHGVGAELDIDEHVSNFILENFEVYHGLGGTCAQGVAALAAVGVPTIAHITDRSKEVCEWLKSPKIEFIDPNTGEKISAEQISENKTPLYHFILQYDKGDELSNLGIVPESNRMILDFDSVHKHLPIDEKFLEYCETNAQDIYSYNISGFNTIIDDEITNKRLDELTKHYKTIKQKNKQCYIYLEGAHYLNSEVKKKVLNTLAPYIDILGMNEEELVDYTEKMEQPVDKDDLLSVVCGIEEILRSHPTKGVVMHTKDYSLYIGDKLEGVDIQMGLTIGNLLAGARAHSGGYADVKNCERFIQEMPLSPAGLAFYDQLSSVSSKYYACLVPSRYIDKPIVTVGLGDSFTAGLQTCFIR